MPMTTQEKIISIIAEQLGMASSGDEIDSSTSLVDDLGADSLDQIELVMQIEESFDMHIPDEDIERLKTVGAIVEYVERKKIH